MISRVATDAEVESWRRDGWVLLEGLVSTDEVDACTEDLRRVFPSAEDYHADPLGVTEARKGGRPGLFKPREGEFVWPDNGPGFRPDQ